MKDTRAHTWAGAIDLVVVVEEPVADDYDLQAAVPPAGKGIAFAREAGLDGEAEDVEGKMRLQLAVEICLEVEHLKVALID
jgi:hypothetical protein